MSIYNHRPMVPNSQTSRLLETLETIKSQFDQLAQEAYICKSQKEDYENKIAIQLKEMTKIQQKVLDLERNQHVIKKQYEDEIARLRQQLETKSIVQQQQQQQPQVEQPPNIGPGSNYFGSIISAGLEAPPQNSPQPTVFSPKPSNIALIDIDPNTIAPGFKTEGTDWFALFNPKIKRTLNINLHHSFLHSSVVCCVKFSADGRYLAAGCNRVTFIYDVATGIKISTLKDDSISQEGDLYIRSVSFSPDSRFLATGAEDKQIRIWDIGARRIRNVLSGHSQDIYSLDFSRDGRTLASGSGDRTTRIWNMADGSCQHVLRITDANQKDPGVTSVAISHDCRLVATGSLDKMVRVWDIQTGQLMEQLEGHRDSVYSVAFMPNTNELVSGSLDKTVKLWKLGTNSRGFVKNPCKMTFAGHKDFVLSIACSADGKWIISGSKDRTIQFWDSKTGQPQVMLQGHKNSVISVAVASDNRPLFASGSGDNYARIWSYSM